MSKLIAMVDGSAYSESLCRSAAWIASRTGAVVEIVHVIRRPEQGAKQNLSGNITLGARTALLEELAELDGARARVAQALGREILADAEALVRAGGVTDVSTKLRMGYFVDTLMELEDQADLILMGKRGETSDDTARDLGSNFERAVRSVHGTVFVAARKYRPIKRVLVAYDGGQGVSLALDDIVQNPLFEGLPHHLIHVGEESPRLQSEIGAIEARLTAANRPASSEVRSGVPDNAIRAAVAEGEHDLLVMGAFGHSRVRAIFTGSVTADLIRACRIPVMLYR
ncbi:MAG: universal stress protein [Pseudomonadota bacterium]